jgi:hypothetical protein
MPTWGQYHGLYKGLGDNVIRVTVTYKRKRSIWPGFERIKTVFPIDIYSFTATDASDHNWDKKLYKEVKK